jgi:hypothetical protein
MQKRDFAARRTGTGSRCPPASITTISPGSTSRTNSAPMMSSAQVSEARIQAPVEIAEHQRPDAERIAAADQLLGCQRRPAR